ncbi:hypothetical protein HPB52_018421 [Rhipicephalus sanguineus]|uniref:Uncharacterized protein n=1 Tax=Rhipicephalus sanguineus TaxID=34632 RepID=A0A9D4Q2K8_RHISA|nr:hypothetical protein HPB52_018421 [Rhipicephalus sanguineus]
MDTGIVGIVNPNFSLPGEQPEQQQQQEAVAAGESDTKDASTMTPNQQGAPQQNGALEEGEFELYQTCRNSGREFNLSKLLGRMRPSSSSSSTSAVHVKAEVSDALLKKPSAVYSATASIMGKLTAWMDRKGSATSTSGKEKGGNVPGNCRDADTQTEGGDHEQGPPFEDVPL